MKLFVGLIHTLRPVCQFRSMTSMGNIPPTSTKLLLNTARVIWNHYCIAAYKSLPCYALRHGRRRLCFIFWPVVGDEDMQKIKKCKKRKKHASPGVTAKSTLAPSALPQMPEMTKKVGSARDAGFIQLIEEVLNFREEGRGGERRLIITAVYSGPHCFNVNIKFFTKRAANRPWCSRF